MASCHNYHRNKSYASIPESAIVEGEKLAGIYCQSCHELPDPSLLDVTSWEQGVLPQMGPRLGIFKHNFKYYPSLRKDPDLDPTYYPSRPMLSAHEWQRLMDFYLATSPDSLPRQSRPAISNKTLPQFSIELPPYRLDTPALSYIGIQIFGKDAQVFFNDIIRQKLYSFRKGTEASDSVANSGNIVDLEYLNKRFVVCDIGQLNPTNGKFGQLRYDNDSLFIRDSATYVPMASMLARPVDFAIADLNKDGRADYVVCEFGHLTGSLSWIEDQGDNKFIRHVLSPQTGAIKAYVTDYNKDGLPDIWAMFSQGNESIIVFTNLGNGRFHPEKVLSFPAVYGSSYFELADFNNDGHADILYTCGDNADFSMVLKPYHGVYIYLNDGRDNFKQQYFFPLHGCFKAMARDFDKDGDLDIATIGFFADFEHQPEEGFVYLENKGQYQFEPFTFPESQLGRWLTMDVGDLDGNGSPDIVLGNFSVRPSETKSARDWKKGPPYIILRNLR